MNTNFKPLNKQELCAVVSTLVCGPHVFLLVEMYTVKDDRGFLYKYPT